MPTMSHTITMRPRKRHLGGEQRRALRLLACNPFGATEAIMHVHGFTRPMLAKLVRAGLATAQSESCKAFAVGRIRISGGSKRDHLTPSPTAGSRGSDPRPLGPTMGGRPDRTCGERPRASRIAYL